MNMFRLLVVVSVCLFIRSEGSSLPGAKVRLSQKGLDYVTKTAIGFLDLKGQTINDMHGKKGHLDYHMTGTKVTSFGKPSSSVVVNPGTGVTWTAKGASAALHGDWRWHFRWHFVKASDHGTFDISASGIDFTLSFIFGKDGNGRPTIRSTGCSANVGHISFKMHGGLTSKIINIFRSWVSHEAKDQIKIKMCEAALKLINVDAAKKLAETKVITDIGSKKEMVLDYRLTQTPVFKTGYMDVMLKGEFAWKSAPKVPPFHPQPFPATNDFSKMFYVWLSEHVVNTYTFAAYDKKKVQHTLTRESLPGGEGDFLNTTCTQTKDGCVGNYLTEMAKEHPRTSVFIEMAALEAPVVRIAPSEMAFHLKATMKTYLRTPLGNLYLFDIQVTVEMEIFPWIDGATLKGKIHSLRPSIKTVDTKIGQVTDAFVNWLFEMVSNKFIVKELNKIGQQGLPIPNLKQLKFTNPDLRLLSGSLMVSTDLKWTP